MWRYRLHDKWRRGERKGRLHSGICALNRRAGKVYGPEKCEAGVGYAPSKTSRTEIGRANGTRDAPRNARQAPRAPNHDRAPQPRGTNEEQVSAIIPDLTSENLAL